MLRTTRRWLFVSLGAYVVDQLTKAWIASHPEWGVRPHVVVPGFFELVSWRNPGMMFSLLHNAADPWRKVLLTVFPAVAILAILILMSRIGPRERFTPAGFALVLAGAAGNLTDRLARGMVVDFLRFGFGADPVRSWLDGAIGTHWWPAFNVADSCICVGAFLIALEVLRPGRASRKT